MNSPKRLPVNRQLLLLTLCLVFVLPALINFAARQPSITYAQALPTETPDAAPTDTIDCSTELPEIEWLGEGSGRYVLGDGFDTFIVKRRPFSFQLDAGRVNSQGETVYRAQDNERVWQCQGNCQLPALHAEPFTLGPFDVGTTFQLVVIDDDGPEQKNDQRKNWWSRQRADEPLRTDRNPEMVGISRSSAGFRELVLLCRRLRWHCCHLFGSCTNTNDCALVPTVPPVLTVPTVPPVLTEEPTVPPVLTEEPTVPPVLTEEPTVPPVLTEEPTVPQC
ncbi:MAG: hypothetical protein R2932_07230 [Caldilineaceae bacterium]